MYYISLYYFVVYCKSFKERFFKNGFLSESGCKGRRFLDTSQTFYKLFLKKNAFFILSVTQTLDNQTMLKNMFLKKKDSGRIKKKGFCIPYYNKYQPRSTYPLEEIVF